MSVDDSATRSPLKPQTSSNGLRGSLGTWSLIMTVIAYNGPIIVLAGVIPLVVSSGNGLAAPSTFLTLGILVGVFAVGLNAMASRMTHAGAFYTYITAGLGRAPGLAAGSAAIIAYLTIGSSCMALFGISFHDLLANVFGVQGGPPWQFWAIAGWLVIAALSMFNIELSAKVIGALSLSEIALALIWNGRVLSNGGPEGRIVNIFSDYFSGSLAFALVLSIVCVTGFESLQVFRSETKDPSRTVPRATYACVALLTALCTVSTYSYIVGEGASNAVAAGAEDPTGTFLASVAHYVSGSAGHIANCLLTTSTFAAALAIQTILSRYLFSLGRDGVLPRKLGEPNAKHGSPMYAAIAASTATLAILLLPAFGIIDPSNAFATLLALGTYCLVLLYFGTSIAVAVFFARRPQIREAKWNTTIAPVLSSVGMAGILYLSTTHMSDVLGQSQTVATFCLVFVYGALGVSAMAAMWFRRNRPETYQKIGNQSEVVDE
jgi:amino acid transporter